MKNKNLFYTDVFYPFAATKYKYKMRTSVKVDLKQNIVLKIIHLKINMQFIKIINMLLTN